MILFGTTIILLAVVGVVASLPLEDWNPINNDLDVPLVKAAVTPPDDFKQIQLPPKSTIVFPQDLVPTQVDTSVEDNDRRRHLRAATLDNTHDSERRLSPTHRVDIWVYHDNFPWEVSWELSNSAGFVLASQAANSYFIQGRLVSQTFYLTHGTYNWYIGDTMCDGLCCAYGNGAYFIDVDSVPVASGSEFGCSDYKSFTVGEVGRTQQSNNVVLDIIMDNFPSEVAWEITDWNGVPWGGHSAGYYSGMEGENIFEYLTLPSGMYTLRMTDTAGDGLCCGHGMGSFVLNVDGYPALFGGNYEWSMSGDFYVD